MAWFHRRIRPAIAVPDASGKNDKDKKPFSEIFGWQGLIPVIFGNDDFRIDAEADAEVSGLSNYILFLKSFAGHGLPIIFE